MLRWLIGIFSGDGSHGRKRACWGHRSRYLLLTLASPDRWDSGGVLTAASMLKHAYPLLDASLDEKQSLVIHFIGPSCH